MRKLFALLVLAACKRAAPPAVHDAGPAAVREPPREVREVEPNDRAEQAQVIEAGARVLGTFSSAKDQDWFRLTVPSGQVVRVQVSTAGRAELDVRADDGALLGTYRAQGDGGVFARDVSGFRAVEDVDAGASAAADVASDAAGSPDAARSSEAAGSPDAAVSADAAGFSDAASSSSGGPADAAAVAQPVDAGPPPPRDVFLVLRRGEAGASYELTATLEPAAPDLEIEPNDDVQHATPLGATASGYLSPAGDTDWYRIRTDAPSVLQLQLTGLSEEVDIAAFELSDDGKPQILAFSSQGILPAVGIGPEDAFLRLRFHDPAHEDREHPYKLTANLLADDGTVEREPNGTVDTAQELFLPIAVSGHLWPARDVDIFRFHVPKGHPPVTIALTPPRTMPLSMRLLELHEDGPEVIGTSSANPPSLVSVPLKEGDYAVEVRSPRDAASATESYELHVSP